MSAILIIGESGTGKSTSIRNLNPKETFIINVLGKPLPFRSYRKNYVKLKTENGKTTGNYRSTDKWQSVVKLIKGLSENRNDIKNIIIDDFQYIMAFEFMNRALEKGYDKFTEIAKHAFEVINAAVYVRNDLNCYFLTHSDIGSDGKSKAKTIGKMLDEKICLEGLFTIVLHSLIIEGEYKFLTRNDGCHLAKSPMDMFEDKYIDNDLAYVSEKICEYFNDDDLDNVTQFEKPEVQYASL